MPALIDRFCQTVFNFKFVKQTINQKGYFFLLACGVGLFVLSDKSCRNPLPFKNFTGSSILEFSGTTTMRCLGKHF
jgi:hypothetical protein